MLKIPTDSLIKFIAIGGLVLIVIGGYGIHYSYETNRENELKSIDRLLYWHTENAKSRNKLVIAIEEAKKRKENKSNDIDKKNIKSESKIELFNTLAEMEKDTIEYKYSETKYISYLTLSILAILMGSLLSLYGFRKWHLSEKTCF